MKYAYVTTNLADLWAEPRYNSERASQLLFAELVTLTDEKDGFALVQQRDGYTGWVDFRYLKDISTDESERYREAASSIVTRPQVEIMSVRGKKSPPPHFIYYGTRIVTGSSQRGVVKGLLPDGGEFLSKTRAFSQLAKAKKIASRELVKEAYRFLGIPYLWGGVSPAGFDCSGFVRAIYGHFGIYLPRDTKDQVGTGYLVERENVRAGDLLFFNRHVGIALDGKRIIHASLAGGGVRVNSLDSKEPDYRADLDRDYNQARRVL